MKGFLHGFFFLFPRISQQLVCIGTAISHFVIDISTSTGFIGLVLDFTIAFSVRQNQFSTDHRRLQLSSLESLPNLFPEITKGVKIGRADDRRGICLERKNTTEEGSGTFEKPLK